MMMKAKVLDISGNVVKEIALPSVFEEPYRPDLIKRAVLAAQANRQQPYGPHMYAGLRTSAESWGPGRGVSRVPRVHGSSRAARMPGAVKGRQAHPPKPEADRTEKINNEERRKAIGSAIAATANKTLVEARGHRFEANLPIITEDSLENLKTTKDVKAFLEKIGVWDDILRAKSKTVRAGKGKMRGRRYKKPKSVLIVTLEDKGIGKAARNLPGVDILTANLLNAEALAPGTHAGRLTIWTESAISKLGKDKEVL
jgi:large subunit ribosomal protein L4e